MSTETITTDSTVSFVEAVNNLGITSVVVAYRKEWGPQDPALGIDYGPQENVRLLGYKQGTLVTCQLEQEDPETVAKCLRREGLTVEMRCRNLA